MGGRLFLNHEESPWLSSVTLLFVKLPFLLRVVRETCVGQSPADDTEAASMTDLETEHIHIKSNKGKKWENEIQTLRLLLEMEMQSSVCISRI